MQIPQLSLEERDRRYKKVRTEMARRDIDCLLLPANTGRWEQLQADSRYLSSIGGFATEVFTVFPLEGEVTAYIFSEGDSRYFSAREINQRDGDDARNPRRQKRRRGFFTGALGGDHRKGY